MCTGPTVPSRGTGGSLAGVPSAALISGGVGRRPGTGAAREQAQATARAPVDALRALIERSEAAGGNLLRGLALPQTNPTGPQDLKNLMSTYIPSRKR